MSDLDVQNINSKTGNSAISIADDGSVSLSNSFSTVGIDDNATSTAITIDSNENVGIGTSSPDGKLNVFSASAGSVSADADADELVLENSGNVGLSLLTASTGESGIYFGNPGTGGQKDFYLKYYHESHATTANRRAFTFNTASTERMRITSDAYLLVGTTSTTVNTTNFGTRIGGTASPTLKSFRNAGAGSTCCAFGGNAGEAIVKGDGDLQNTNNSYGAISDERFKSNIVDASSQIDDIMAVHVRSYTLNETGATHIGVVAQELEASGMSGLVKTNDEGMKSVKYSILYLKAVKALQEAVTRIETLEAEVAALKGA